MAQPQEKDIIDEIKETEEYCLIVSKMHQILDEVRLESTKKAILDQILEYSERLTSNIKNVLEKYNSVVYFGGKAEVELPKSKMGEICDLILKIYYSIFNTDEPWRRKEYILLLYQALNIFLDILIGLIHETPIDQINIDQRINEIVRELEKIDKM